MDVCVYIEKENLKTVMISKDGVTVNLSAEEWQEVQDTIKGNKFAIISSDMDGYVPEFTLLKNKERYEHPHK